MARKPARKKPNSRKTRKVSIPLVPGGGTLGAFPVAELIACENQEMGMEPFYGWGPTRRAAEDQMRALANASDAAKEQELSCNGKTCVGEDHRCAYDSYILTIACNEQTVTSKRGRQITSFVCFGLHLYGCWCLDDTY
ncbi:MAG: hypothetical protein H8D70_01600 [Rhodospirillaceae bacterium]|nr:hypothetical protein [Rhodospirillaceae bacterium]